MPEMLEDINLDSLLQDATDEFPIESEVEIAEKVVSEGAPEVLSEESPLDMIQKVIIEWRNGDYDTNLQALLAVDAIMNSGDTPKDERAWAKSVMRDLKINEVGAD